MNNEQTTTPTDIPSCVPPKQFKRNEYGLICDSSVQYAYREDGSINWRRMIKPEFLVPFKEVFEKRGRPIPENIQGLEDKELLILLGGIKELAATRGFTNVKQVITHGKDRVSAACSITWVPNFETYGQEVTFTDGADATPDNTNVLGRTYMTTIALNRAFVRAVRNFLKIPIIGSDELGGPTSHVDTDSSETSLLKETMKNYGVPFEVIKKKLIEEGFKNAENINDLDDIPRVKQFELIKRMKDKAAENAAKASQV